VSGFVIAVVLETTDYERRRPMKIAKQDTGLFHNGPTCTVHKYDFPSSPLGLITAEIKKRYPEQGKVLNEKCDETYFVLSGSCTVHDETGGYGLAKGDTFFFAKGKWYWVEVPRLVKLVVCTVPPWTEDQHQLLP
jgi:mannose-6-phosphate isomerase-like protein (cupin superfamily)